MSVRAKERLIRLLDAGRLPEDALFDCARVILSGRNSVTVEGQHGVVELSPSRIRLKTGSGILSITGEGLLLRELSPEKAVIMGEAVGTVSFQ